MTPESYLAMVQTEQPSSKARYRYFRNTVFIIFLLAFFLGSYTLETIGIPYTSRGGSFVFKIHVYSLVILALTGFMVLRRGSHFLLVRPVAQLGSAPFFFLISAGWVAVYGVIKSGTGGMAYIVDTLFTPALALFFLPHLKVIDRLRLTRLIGCLLIINTVIATVESLGKFYLINDTFNWNGRAVALMAHPLNNGLILLVCFPLFIQYFKSRTQVIAAGLAILGMLGFGARAATALLLLPMLYLFGKAFIRFITAQTLSRKDTFLIIYFGFIISIPGLLLLVEHASLGNRFFDTVSAGEVDTSAQTRLDVYNIFFHLTFNEWLNGATPQLIARIPDIINNDIVENFWIGWLLQFGVLGMLPIGLALIYFNGRMLMVGPPMIKLSALLFFLGSYTNNSLMAKTPLLLFYFSLAALYFINQEANTHK